MQRRPSLFPIRSIGEYIWRVSLCKEDLERWNISTSCGIVDGITRKSGSPSLSSLVYCSMLRELFMNSLVRVAEKCAQALRNELWPAMEAHTTQKVVGARS